MGQVISIGKQDFVSLRENRYFYIDKTDFIRQWWENADDITLITRPRRFGKTLNMSMLNCFFSRQYAERGDLFEGLSIWEEEKYRELQGTYPVIFISFADVKQNNYEDAVQKIKNIIDNFNYYFEGTNYIYVRDRNDKKHIDFCMCIDSIVIWNNRSAFLKARSRIYCLSRKK